MLEIGNVIELDSELEVVDKDNLEYLTKLVDTGSASLYATELDYNINYLLIERDNQRGHIGIVYAVISSNEICRYVTRDNDSGTSDYYHALYPVTEAVMLLLATQGIEAL